MTDEITYGRYIIRSRNIAGKWKAQAIRGKAAIGDSQSGETQEDAISSVKAALDATSAAQRAARGKDGYPSTEQVRAALNLIPITKGQHAMLNAHLLASENIMTATELAIAGGYDSYVSANSQYGSLGRKLAEELEWNPPSFNGVPTWTFALATGVDEDTQVEFEHGDFDHGDYVQWKWKLRPEVVAALRDRNL
jgi:predicted ABC-type transport system involved in lysophospholipase L1 biosynthesis ATPase subunit